MCEPDLDEWRRLVRAHSEAQGQRLSPDVVEELVSHLADVHATERDLGRSDEEATAAARRVLEGAAYSEVAATRRAAASPSRLIDRAPRFDRLLADLAFDVRYALRGMRRQAAVSFAIVAILATGIGATTAVYAAIECVLIKALPYPSASRLVVMKRVTPAEVSGAFSPADWRDYAARHRSSLTLAAYASWPMNLTGTGEPERLRSVIVSGEFFDVAGSPPALGRTTTAPDDRESSPAVVVLSHGFWTRRFGANPSVVGTNVVLNDRVATVVGVMGPGFALPDASVDLWMPMGLAPAVLEDRAGGWLSLIGRLRPGVTPGAVQAELAVTSAQLAARFPRTNGDARAVVRPLLDEVVGGVRRPLWLGGLAVVFVLLAGTANAANLMVARATMRRDEIAIRSALGADPRRLARQLLAESGVLAGIGGIVGVALSWAFLRAFVVMADERVPRVQDLGLDASALAVAIAVSVTTALAVGGAAAWLVLRSRPDGAMRTSLQRATRSSGLGALLLGTQVAFAMMLVGGTALVVDSYVATLRVDPGFDVSDTMTMQLTLPRRRYPDDAAHVRFADRALAAVAGVPGVLSAGLVSDLPFVGNATHFPVRDEGQPPEAAKLTTVRLADPGLFRTLRVPLAGGRYFEAGDRAGRGAVAILNRTAARRYEDGPVLGRRIEIAGEGKPRTVVGIVGDIRHAGLHASEGAVVYVPYAQKAMPFLNWMGIVARTSGPVASAAALKDAVSSVDPNQPVQAVQPMAEYVAGETAPYRFGSLVAGSLAAAALVLAVTGIYGLTAFVVGGRSRELALRMVLGATPAAAALVVVRQVALVFGAGAVAGLAGSVVTNGLLTVALAEGARGGRDVTATLAAGLLMSLSAALAALGPALRAARLDPRTALQAE